jgi:hypothetical protein
MPRLILLLLFWFLLKAVEPKPFGQNVPRL